VADEEGVAVVVGVEEPGGDVVDRRGAELFGRRVVDVKAAISTWSIGSGPWPLPEEASRTSMSGSPKTMNRSPVLVFLRRSSPIARSAFMRARFMRRRPRLEACSPTIGSHAKTPRDSWRLI
jgi:hypothetical protein